MTQTILAFGFFAIAAMGLLGNSSVALVSSVTVALGLGLLLDLFQRKLLATALLALFLLYGLLPVWAMQVLGRIPLSNWRGEHFAPEALEGAVIYYCTAFALFGFGATAGAAFWHVTIPHKPACRPRHCPSLRRLGPTLIASALALTTAALFLGVTRDAWIGTASIADRFVMQATTVATVAAFGYTLEDLRQTRHPTRWIDYVPLAVAGLVALQGFRFMLVSALLTLLVANRDRLVASPKTVARIALGGAAAYVVLILGMGVRAVAGAQGIGATEALARLDPLYLSHFIGAPEQTGMLALKYFTETPVPRLHGQTYVDAVLRILPNAVHTAFFETIRPQDYILANFTWVSTWFRENQLNIGAHLFLEGIINFGLGGGLRVAFAVGALLPVIDLLPSRRNLGVPLLYGVATFAYSAAWYGSSAFFKYTAYYIAIYLVLRAIGRLRWT